MQAYAKRNKEHVKYTERDYLLDVDGSPNAMHALYMRDARTARLSFRESNTIIGRKIFKIRCEKALIAAYTWRVNDFLFSF